MKRIFQISLIVLLVFAFTFAVLQVLPGCQATSGFVCTNVGWNNRAESSSPVSYLAVASTGAIPNVGWNS